MVWDTFYGPISPSEIFAELKPHIENVESAPVDSKCELKALRDLFHKVVELDKKR
jgi:hypothetical protein